MATDRIPAVWTFVEEEETDTHHPVFSEHRFGSRDEAIKYQKDNNIEYDVGIFYETREFSYHLSPNYGSLNNWVYSTSGFLKVVNNLSITKIYKKNCTSYSRLTEIENKGIYSIYDVMTYSHLCKPSETSPGKIAYVQSPEKASQNIWTVCTPGRYLTKYFKDYLSAETIEKMANKFVELYGDNSIELKWATNADEFEEVYSMDASFESCMQYDADYWESCIHPARAYDSGEFEICYIESDNRLLARALYHKPTGKVGRVYGNCFSLRAALKKEGIITESSNSSYDTFEGAKLDKIHYEDNYYVMPYVDGSCYAKDDGTHFILCDYNEKTIGTDNTCGISYNIEPIKCTNCDNKVNENDIVVYHENDDSEIKICSECIREVDTFRCGLNNKYYNSNKFNQIEVIIYGATYNICKEYHEYYLYMCDKTGNLKHDRYESKRNMWNGEIWSQSYINDSLTTYSKCEHSKLYYPHDQVVEVKTSHWLNKYVAKEHLEAYEKEKREEPTVEDGFYSLVAGVTNTGQPITASLDTSQWIIQDDYTDLEESA